MMEALQGPLLQGKAMACSSSLGSAPTPARLNAALAAPKDSASTTLFAGVPRKHCAHLRGGISRPSIIAAASAHQGDALDNNGIQFSPEAHLQDIGLQGRHVPFYVMLPMDTVTMLSTLRRVKALQAGLRALKLIGVDGVMMHVWWGVVEGRSNPDIFFSDRAGNRFKECLSLSVDSVPLGGRVPLQMYRDFLENFRETFSSYIGTTIVEVIMGLGPDGELRYPAFQEGSGIWRFPGVGEFQCYDKYMLESLKKYAEALGKQEWRQFCPEDVPSYNQSPNDSGFFKEENGSWRSPSGHLFLSWYSGELLAHGNRMLSVVSSVFQKDRVVVVGKVPGVHWWYKSKSHAAEVTAGYYNIEGQDGYEKIARMFRENSAMMILPCMEMSDKEQPKEAHCSPEMLLLQIRKACSRHGVPVSGQNSVPRFDDVAYSRIKNSIHRFDYPYIPRLAVFTFLRMGESLFYAEHWRLFVNFVRNMDKDAVWGDTHYGPPESGQNQTFLGAAYLHEHGVRLQPMY